MTIENMLAKKDLEMAVLKIDSERLKVESAIRAKELEVESVTREKELIESSLNRLIEAQANQIHSLQEDKRNQAAKIESLEEDMIGLKAENKALLEELGFEKNKTIWVKLFPPKKYISN